MAVSGLPWPVALRRRALAWPCSTIVPKRSSDLVSGLDTDAQNTLVLPCDVSKESDVDDAFKKIGDHFGGLDVLVNNAGIIAGCVDAQVLRR